MAKPRSRRLKVFQAQIGFYDTVVAAPSQAAALRAWGVRQNLFAEKRAQLADDPDAVAAALAYPETPLKRPLGSGDPFALEPANLPKAPPAPRRGRATPAKAQTPQAPPPTDRSRLDHAEDAVRDLDERRRREEAELRRRQADLDAEGQAAQEAYVSARQAATAAVVEAREAYRKAGGRD